MKRCNLLIAFVAILAATMLKAQGEEPPRVMLVLDGSSSMWSRVDGDVSKIEVAKQTVADLVGDWEAKMEFGITTYGHREEGNCDDIETVLPVGKVESDEVVNAVNKILPRGKTPLAAALRQAAERLDYKNQPATILLVSDGIENCGQDPCQTVADLAAKAKDLTIDIVGFDMNNHQMGQLECIATHASGRMVRADIADFAEAMGHSMDAAIDVEKPTATLSISTTLVGKMVTEDIRYVVYLNEDDDFSLKLTESFASAPTFTLPVGKFSVQAIRGEGAGALGKAVEVELIDGAHVEHIFKLAEFRPLDR
ncbi:MAG: vWA domain-containing protein [Geminicoccaceae bacterium]